VKYACIIGLTEQSAYILELRPYNRAAMLEALSVRARPVLRSLAMEISKLNCTSPLATLLSACGERPLLDQQLLFIRTAEATAAIVSSLKAWSCDELQVRRKARSKEH
jgi:hypothetical protein